MVGNARKAHASPTVMLVAMAARRCLLISFFRTRQRQQQREAAVHETPAGVPHHRLQA